MKQMTNTYRNHFLRSYENRSIVLISNNYTEVSDENGTLFFFFYDLKGSIYKNELTMYRKGGSTGFFRGDTSRV